jgi:acetyl-CoA carboxylase biotin carboxyl carrier protein
MVADNTTSNDVPDPRRPSAEGIRALADLCRRTGVDELEASVGAWSVRLRLDFRAAAELPEAIAAPPVPAEAERAYVLRSEWVGVFHRALEPDGTPFMLEGQQVRDGDVVGLIEAMQLLHEQRADRDGTILRFLLDEGAPVEYGQPILEIG